MWKEGYLTIFNESEPKNHGKNWKDKYIVKNISTDSISEMNDLIYAWTKLANDKLGNVQRNPNRNTKPWGEMWLEGQMQKVQEQGEILKKKKCSWAQWNEMKEKSQQ